MTKITTRITKLLALAESSNANEAAVAAAMADRLMREHALSMADLSEAAILSEDPMVTDGFEVGKTTWSIQLAWALGSHCRVYALRSNRYTHQHPWKGTPLKGGRKGRIFALGCGHKSDMEVWEYLYVVARREIQREAKAYRAELLQQLDWRGEIRINGRWVTERTAMTMFREGAVSGLAAKLRQQRYKADTAEESTALVLQDRAARAKAEAERQFTIGSGYSGGVGSSRAGHAAGQSINLNPGIRARKSRMLGGE